MTVGVPKEARPLSMTARPLMTPVLVPSREMTISPFLISWLIFSSVRLLAKSRSSIARLMHFPLISGRFSRVAT